MKTITILSTLFLTIISVRAQSDWVIDESHTSIRFTVPHMGVSEAEGTFREFTGSVTNANDDFSEGKVYFTSQVSSIDTDNERRDNHLRGDDFFNAEEYPEIIFDGNLVREGDKYYIVGDFTMKGITRQVKFDVKYNGKIKLGESRPAKAGFKVTGELDRFDYNLKWNRITEGVAVVGQTVSFTCNVELDEKR